MSADPVSALRGGVVIAVQARPRASRSEVVGLHGGAVRVRLAAPPVDGAANRELVRFLADLLGVPKGSVAVVRGHSGRSKTVRVEGMGVPEVRARLGV